MIVHDRVPSMKRSAVLLFPLDGMLDHQRIPSMKRSAVLLLPLDGMLDHQRIPIMKRSAVLLLPLGWMLVHHRIPSMKRLAVLLPLPHPGLDSSPSHDTQLKDTRSVTTPPPPVGMLVHPRVTPEFRVVLSV